jgi:hydrogenase/urease accessory protein HupE
MLHPLLSLDQVVPLIALSLLAGQQQRRTAIAVLLALPLAVVAGATAGLVWQAPAWFALFNIAAMVVLGALVALSLPLPRALSCSLSIALGLALGFTLGADVTPDEAPRFMPGASPCASPVAGWPPSESWFWASSGNLERNPTRVSWPT